MTFNTARNILAVRFYGTEEGKEINRILNQVDENPWHTGTPTEEGDYIVLIDGKHFLWEVDDLETWNFEPVTAWQRIEPFEEENNGCFVD